MYEIVTRPATVRWRPMEPLISLSRSDLDASPSRTLRPTSARGQITASFSWPPYHQPQLSRQNQHLRRRNQWLGMLSCPQTFYQAIFLLKSLYYQTFGALAIFKTKIYFVIFPRAVLLFCLLTFWKEICSCRCCDLFFFDRANWCSVRKMHGI